MAIPGLRRLCIVEIARFGRVSHAAKRRHQQGEKKQTKPQHRNTSDKLSRLRRGFSSEEEVCYLTIMQVIDDKITVSDEDAKPLSTSIRGFFPEK